MQNELKIHNFTINYETSDKSIRYKIEVKQGFPLKYNCYGKTCAKRTQITLEENGFVLGTNFITKHHNDNDDLKYAVVNTLKPLMNKINLKWLRAEIWKEVFKTIELCKKN